jgi:hypothetical protein
MGFTTGEKRKNLEDRAVAAITQSVALAPANAIDVQTDRDLKNLRESGRIQHLLKEPLADPGHDETPSNIKDTSAPSDLSKDANVEKSQNPK